jgi:uncharacterized surface protein with fasciclin (FAS1) repeats
MEAMIFRHRRELLAAGLAALGVARATGTAMAQPRHIMDAMATDGRFDRFIEIVQRGGLGDTLRGPGPITVFAPVNAAFTGPMAGGLQDLLRQGTPAGSGEGGISPDAQRLRTLVQYHIVSGTALDPMQLAGEQRLRTANGNDVQVALRNGVLTAHNPTPTQRPESFSTAGADSLPAARMDGSHITARNGVIIPITQLLYP